MVKICCQLTQLLLLSPQHFDHYGHKYETTVQWLSGRRNAHFKTYFTVRVCLPTCFVKIRFMINNHTILSIIYFFVFLLCYFIYSTFELLFYKINVKIKYCILNTGTRCRYSNKLMILLHIILILLEHCWFDNRENHWLKSFSTSRIWKYQWHEDTNLSLCCLLVPYDLQIECCSSL